MEGLIVTLFMLLVSPVIMTLNGWALSILWGWFVASQFGLPALSIPQAIGIAMIVAYLANHYARGAKKDPVERFVEYTVFGLTKPFFALGFGYVVKSFL